MASRRVLPIAFSLLMSVPALAQGPTYGIGRTPTAEEIRARDISIGPTGEELPPGKGSAKEGALAYRSKGCAGCHGANGIGGAAPILKSKDPANPSVWARGRILPLRAPFATTVWDYINRGMPLNREGTLTPDEVYGLTAYLLFINGVIPEDQVLDQQNLAAGEDAAGRQLRAAPGLEAADAATKGLPLLTSQSRRSWGTVTTADDDPWLPALSFARTTTVYRCPSRSEP